MKGNLTIDNGNTSVKVAFFIGSQIVASNRFTRRDTRLLDRFISSYKPETATVCSTASSAASQRIVQLVEQRCRRVITLSHETPMPHAPDPGTRPYRHRRGRMGHRSTTGQRL